MSLLSEILSSRVRGKVFENLFDGQGTELHLRELERRSGYTVGTIQTELKKLSRLDLLKSRRDGNRLYYRANQDHPLYPDIRNLVDKTVGIFPRLMDFFGGREDVLCAFVFGSMAEGTEKAASDVDLLVIGDAGMRALSSGLAEISKAVGREINFHVIPGEEFRKRVLENEHFIAGALKSPRAFVKGGEDELARLAGKRLAAPT